MNFLEASLVMEDQLQEEGWTREQYTRPVWREWIYRPTALTTVCKIHEFDKEKKSFYISDMMAGYLRVTHAAAPAVEATAGTARKTGRTDNIWTNSYEELTEIK